MPKGVTINLDLTLCTLYVCDVLLSSPLHLKESTLRYVRRSTCSGGSACECIHVTACACACYQNAGVVRALRMGNRAAAAWIKAQQIDRSQDGKGFACPAMQAIMEATNLNYPVLCDVYTQRASCASIWWSVWSQTFDFQVSALSAVVEASGCHSCD